MIKKISSNSLKSSTFLVVKKCIKKKKTAGKKTTKNAKSWQKYVKKIRFLKHNLLEYQRIQTIKF